jgi:hypothetical protein
MDLLAIVFRGTIRPFAWPCSGERIVALLACVSPRKQKTFACPLRHRIGHAKECAANERCSFERRTTLPTLLQHRRE